MRANPRPNVASNSLVRSSGRISASPRLNPRVANGRTRIGTRVTSRLYGNGRFGFGFGAPGFGGRGFGAVASSWWDPCFTSYWPSNCWNWGFGRGCYGFGGSLWYPFYWGTSWRWNGFYDNCWWNSWSQPAWGGYWWYPQSTYCPTYLYVPSTSAIYIEDGYEGIPADPAAEDLPPVATDPAPAAADETPDLAAKYVELGDFYFRAGRFTEAADAYARARSYAPDDAPLHFVLADAAFATGDYHFAAFLIAEGLRLDPALADVKVDKREFYGDPKLFDEHMAALDKYLADKKYDASAHLVRGYNLAFSGRPMAAIAAFERVLEIAPDHRAARRFLEALAPKKGADEAKPGER